MTTPQRVATTQHTRIDGMPGSARCFRISPPLTFAGGKSCEYVNIWVRPPTPVQNADTGVYPASASGGFASMRAITGFHVLPDYEESNEEYTNGCHFFALTQLGYKYVAPEDFPQPADSETEGST